jgi:hypothetical protein
MIFYKGTLNACLNDRFIPGIVTTDIRVAKKWKDRLRTKNSCLIEIEYLGSLESINTNKRIDNTNHWLPNRPSKARINSVCKFKII